MIYLVWAYHDVRKGQYTLSCLLQGQRGRTFILALWDVRLFDCKACFCAQIGKTRVFLRAGQLAQLEGARGRRLTASALTIQAAFRCLLRPSARHYLILLLSCSIACTSIPLHGCVSFVMQGRNGPAGAARRSEGSHSHCSHMARLCGQADGTPAAARHCSSPDCCSLAVLQGSKGLQGPPGTVFMCMSLMRCRISGVWCAFRGCWSLRPQPKVDMQANRRATIIQAHVRGYLTRSSFRKATELGKRQAARAALQAKRNTAAVVIQKHVRRCAACKRVCTHTFFCCCRRKVVPAKPSFGPVP